MLIRRLAECLGALVAVTFVLMALLGALDPAFGAPSVPPVVVVTAQPIKVPPDRIARARFPRTKASTIDKVAFVNAYVNAAITPVEDKVHYGLDDFWVMAPHDGKGDCEDYALTKLLVLEEAGWDVVTRAKLVAVEVDHDADDKGHLILALRLPSGEVAYLDNRFPEPMTRRGLLRAGYQFFDWRA